MYAKERTSTIKVLPDKPMPMDKLMKMIEKGEKDSRECWADGKSRISGAVYISDDAHWNFINDVLAKFIQTNPLHLREF